MEKFGTGAAQAIWAWWSDLHQKTFAEATSGEKRLVAYITLAIPFVIAVVGVILVGIFDAFVELFQWVGGWFNQTDDDEARELIGRSSCQQLNALRDDRIVSMINSMLDGPTGDDDENAILKLLGCLSCERLHTIVQRVGLNNLQSDIDGSEYDELQVLLGNCGIIRFSDWDDDATRLFVSRASCSQLNALSAQALHQLFRNLIDGSCGDDDEQAINKIMGCIDCGKIYQVMAMDGTRWDDFDDAIQGSEWTQFKSIVGRCGIGG